MEPVTFVGLLALGTAGLIALDRAKEGGKPVRELTKGKSYKATVIVTHAITEDPRWAAVFADARQKGQPLDVADAVRLMIASSFDQSGAFVSSRPEPLTAAEYDNFVAGMPSAWKFDMTWNLPQPYITNVIPWISNAQFVTK